MNVNYRMDKRAIKQAAIEFRQALVYSKSEEKVRKVAAIYRPEWIEEDIINSIQ